MSSMLWRASIVVTCAIASLAAEEPAPPRSPPVQKAERQYALTMEKIRQEMLVADRKRVADLDAAIKIAVNAKDLKEAERIESLKDAAKATMEEHRSGEVTTGAATVNLTGEWDVTYADGATRTYFVDKSGKISLPQDNRTGRINNGVIDMGDGKLER